MVTTGAADEAPRTVSLTMRSRAFLRVARSRRFDSEDRRRVLRALALERGPKWGFRFTVMLSLSVVIAVMGLVSDSAAVVIGAMLVAPLMTPVMALSGALAMGWIRRSGVFAGVVLAASLWSAALAWTLTKLFDQPSLSNELLARTSPRLTDLFIALAAGLAGAYATVRTDMSTSLPGVAVAVALVPPLATVGVTMALGRRDLATGAALLYVANLVAIVLCGIAVFLGTGFVPLTRIRRNARRLAAGAAVSAIAVIAVSFPLQAASARAIQNTQRTYRLNQAATDWLFGSQLDLVSLRVDGQRVVVDVAGATEPPPTETLVEAITTELGDDVDVTVRWSQRTQITNDEVSAKASDTARISPTTVEESDRLTTAQALVTAWLEDYADRVQEFEIDGVELTDDTVQVDLAGPVAPPPVGPLAAALAEQLGHDYDVKVRWSERVSFASSPTDAPEPADESEALRQAADDWAVAHDVRVTSFGIDRSTDPPSITVEVTGTSEPDDVDALTTALTRASDESDAKPGAPALQVSVWFTPRRLLTTTTSPGASPTTTSSAATTSSASSSATTPPNAVGTSPSPGTNSASTVTTSATVASS